MFNYFQPSTGVLGTHRKSAVFELIKNGKRFPDGYFWQVELVSSEAKVCFLSLSETREITLTKIGIEVQSALSDTNIQF